jgi:hypothetical protein
MSETTHDDLVAYLERAGWTQDPPGAYGSLWRIGQSEPVGITHSLDSASPDWTDTIGRIARAAHRSFPEVHHDLQMLWRDEIEFAATGVDGGIGLDAGAALFEMARRAVWNTTAAAFSPRAAFRGSYPKPTRQVVERVTFGHTKVGSYAVPVRYPEDRTLTDEASDAADMIEEVPENSESLQRRASRTLMQALVFVSSEIVEPAREPSHQVLLAGVHAGVTLELVTALRDFLKHDDGLGSLRSSAHWAALIREPNVKPSVVIEGEATPVLQMARDGLAKMRPEDREVIAGPLVGVVNVDPDADRTAGVPAVVQIQTIRHGRSCKVQVKTFADQWHSISEWLHSGEVVVASGSVITAGGMLMMRDPSRLNPIGQVILPGTE